MNITELFQLIAKNIQNDMLAARTVLTHPGMKGAVTEQIVTDFLRKYLPPKLALTSGILIDSGGGVTKQLDIIIYDANKTPTLFLNGGVRVIPVECAYAVIEVKMQLTDIEGCIKNMESVKALKRVAYHVPDSLNIHAMTIHGKQSPHWPETLYFVFAFENKISLSQIKKKLDEYAFKSEFNKRIDSIYCLDDGYILNRSQEYPLDASPSANSKLTVVKENSLLCFYAAISVYLLQADIPNFNLTKYLADMSFNFKDIA